MRSQPRCAHFLALRTNLVSRRPGELVERYHALISALEQMPAPQPSSTASGGGGAAAMDLLKGQDAKLAAHLEAVMGGAAKSALLLKAPCARLGVGLLSPDATLFVWDLCLIAGWTQVGAAIASALLLPAELASMNRPL